MHSYKELWRQAKADSNAACLDHGETQALISWGIKFEHWKNDDGDDRFELIVAYDGDFYKKLPTHYEEILRNKGWRRGVLYIALDRSINKAKKIQDRIDNADQEKKIDLKKYIESSRRALESALTKSQSIKVKLNIK